jgi:phosphoesterase RecJ-like protein
MLPISEELAAQIKSGKRFLIVTHCRPDGDALGSSFGFASVLRASGREADVIIPAPLPDRYRKFFTRFITSVTQEELSSYDRILFLDCATLERAESGDADLVNSGVTLLNLDHHRGNSVAEAADCSFVEPQAASTCQLAYCLAVKCGFEVPREAATSFLIGMMTDTGNFRFSNTSGDALRCAADLIDLGAELEQAVNTIYFNKSIRQRNFETDLAANALKFACNDRIAYAYITQEMLKKHNFDLKEDEGIIDILREIDTVVIAILINKVKGGYKLSMRSKDSRYPVGPTARKFGGGGHDLAAGATIPANDVRQVLDTIIPEFEKLLEN